MSWETHKLAEIASFKTGKLNSNAAVLDGEFPFFTCAQETFQIDKYAFDTEAVLLAGNNANGVFALKHYNGRFNAYQRTYILETLDPERLNTRFLYFALRPALKRFESESIGATTQYLTKGILDNFKIKVPDLPAQKRIAEVLSAYDDLIENNRRRIALLEQAARLLYREWFVHFRFPGHETVEFVDGLPEGWGVKLFSDVCETIGGGTPSTKVASYWDDGDVPWITPTDITRNDCLTLLDGAKRITKEGLKNSSAKMVPPHTILMTSRASVGFFGIADKEVCTNQGFINIIPNDEAMRFYLLFNLLHRVEEIRAHAGGSTYTEISKSKFRALSVVVPAPDMVEKFDTKVRVMIEQIRSLKKSTEQLTKARDLLLPRLMDGRLPV
ncbi:restriction endonuclease subunit S [Sulfitobacter donghicola]|uniref:Type I restriction endonuclease subunit S n=1 Tax=Sulfitobacter donghicola DSW-25 = KCTC 12864 = JCM 14565 TaxID=1300350 RepID=A0A073IHC5_9RHOB|nr:restriction endonuclease subunit S [Sulfitobacter donghicola]KEJ88911.1 type I restriction endonuclease subunit S [Sulfitobacter donghicola DSW-25 = KCTC 12864 = JCM 14565]KIN67548.1 Restriction modification system DNA specificity domain-containing protein [Sulfitobacter donghicola DSW-25 = KCTC 12864 = JCM 14565]